MKNLTGYLKRILSLSSLLILLLSQTSPISAQSNFNITTEFIHSIDSTTVNTELIISLETETDRVLTYYTATLPLEGITVTCTDLTNNKTLRCERYDRDNATDILIDTNNIVVREGTPLQIKLSYSTELEKTYSFTSYIQDATTKKVTVKYPKEKGEPLWSSDTIQSLKLSGEQYVITIDKPNSLNTSLIFGEIVNYEFQISRVLNNSLTENNETFEIIVPSDTETQTIVFEKIEPLPNVATQDENGNYIFKYIVGPSETLDILISGYIQKHENREEIIPTNTALTNSLGYWKIEGSSEQENLIYFLQKEENLNLPDNFSSITDLENHFQYPLLFKYINSYIKSRLDFEAEINLGIGSGPRLGANSISETPFDLNQEDYADFTIALLRDLDISARMKVGYISNISGYTSDGFYHSWIEAYDVKNKEWITLDPFLEEYWDKTLFGSQYLDHISILTREDSPISPKITFYEPNDFTVTSDQTSTVTPLLSADVSLSFETNNYLNKYIQGEIHFSNTGNLAITAYEILKSNINADDFVDYVNNLNSQIILPKQNGRILINLPSNITETSPFVNISLSNKNGISEEYLLETTIQIQPQKFISILSKLLSVTIFGLLVYLIYFLISKYRNKKQ